MKVLKQDTHPELPIDPDAPEPGVATWPVHLTPAYIAAVFAGGCLGALARYGVAQQLAIVGDFPMATIFVNLLGAFLLGLLLEALARFGHDEGGRRLVRLLLGTGFLGAFTTYSTFAIEVDLLAIRGNAFLAVIYAGVSIVGGLVLAAAGIWIAAAYHKRRSAR